MSSPEKTPPNPATTLKSLKKKKLDQATTTLWLVHRTLKVKDKTASYEVSRIDIDKALETKLRSLVDRKVQDSNILIPYAHESTELDERWMSYPVGDTDFPQIAGQILLGTDAPKVEKVEDFDGAWGTVVVLESGASDAVFAFRKISGAFNTKKLTGVWNAIFKNAKLTEFDSGAVLRIDHKVDFIAFREEVFILDKSAFEAGLNFRKGMETSRDELLADLEKLSLFSDVKPLRERTGNNMHYLRKLSSIKKAKYYSDPDFLKKLAEAAKKEGWPIKFADGKIVLTDENLDVIITLLNNNRVRSMVNEERFDVEGQKRPF